MISLRSMLVPFLSTWLLTVTITSAFSSATTTFHRNKYQMSTTTVAPPATDTKKDTRRRTNDSNNDSNSNRESHDEDYIRKHGPIEYLEDDLEQSRDWQDPFHILLLAETFRVPKMTIPYVSESLSLVLQMPQQDSMDAALFAKENGMSCVGTWTREECLKLGKALQQRDLIVRVVPFVPGGQRPWQANKDASSNSNSNNNNNNDNDYYGNPPGYGQGDFIDADYYYD